VPGRVQAGRASTCCLAERDRLSIERGLYARIEYLNRQPEAGNRIPVGMRTEGPEVEAWIAADTGTTDDNVLSGGSGAGAGAEHLAVDARVVVGDLAVGADHRSRGVGKQEVLVPRPRRPGGGQLNRTAVDVDPIGDHADGHRVAA